MFRIRGGRREGLKARGGEWEDIRRESEDKERIEYIEVVYDGRVGRGRRGRKWSNVSWEKRETEESMEK